MISDCHQASDQIQYDEERDEAKTYHDLEINIENANWVTRFSSISVACRDIRRLTDGVVVAAVDGGGWFNSASRIPSTMSGHIQINDLDSPNRRIKSNYTFVESLQAARSRRKSEVERVQRGASCLRFLVLTSITCPVTPWLEARVGGSYINGVCWRAKLACLWGLSCWAVLTWALDARPSLSASTACNRVRC